MPYKILQILLMEEILHQLRLVVYPIIYRILYTPGGVGFLPSTVGLQNLGMIATSLGNPRSAINGTQSSCHD